MLRRAINSPIRSFSGGSDAYWLHLHQEPDKFAQYAHLHWHTVEPLEVGKYAKFRSAAMYGDHVSHDPAKMDWYPEAIDPSKTTPSMRNELYGRFVQYAPGFISFLETEVDYESHHDQMLVDSATDGVLEVCTPEQIKEAIKVGQKIIEEYKAAGVRYTREAVSDKMSAFLMNNLSCLLYTSPSPRDS